MHHRFKIKGIGTPAYQIQEVRAKSTSMGTFVVMFLSPVRNLSNGINSKRKRRHENIKSNKDGDSGAEASLDFIQQDPTKDGTKHGALCFETNYIIGGHVPRLEKRPQIDAHSFNMLCDSFLHAEYIMLIGRCVTGGCIASGIV